MSHPICAASRGAELEYLQRLWRIMLRPGVDLRSKLEYLLAEETQSFDLEIGFLSRIDREEAVQELDVAYGPVEELVQEDEEIPLEETFCRRTIADPDGSMAVSDAPAEGWDDDPADERFGLGTYVGTTVFGESELYGTLCFANREPRSEPISDDEARLLDMYGTWVSYELHRWPGRTHLRSLASELERADRSVHAEIDQLLESLCDPTRRQVALALVEDESIRVEEFSSRASGDDPRIKLRHVHLPKLEAAGFVEWDADAGTVERGPNFPQIEPVIRLLNEYTMEFPTHQ